MSLTGGDRILLNKEEAQAVGDREYPSLSCLEIMIAPELLRLCPGQALQSLRTEWTHW